MNLETMFLSDEAADLDLTFDLRLDDEAFTLRIARGELEVERGEADDPDAVIATDPMTFVSILYYEEELTAAEKAGTIRIEGDREAVAGLSELFELPEPVEAEVSA
jgi:putative sterol carrier protein